MDISIARIQTLPPELLRQVTDHLDFPELGALASTSRWGKRNAQEDSHLFELFAQAIGDQTKDLSACVSLKVKSGDPDIALKKARFLMTYGHRAYGRLGYLEPWRKKEISRLIHKVLKQTNENSALYAKASLIYYYITFYGTSNNGNRFFNKCFHVLSSSQLLNHLSPLEREEARLLQAMLRDNDDVDDSRMTIEAAFDVFRSVAETGLDPRNRAIALMKQAFLRIHELAPHSTMSASGAFAPFKSLEKCQELSLKERVYVSKALADMRIDGFVNNDSMSLIAAFDRYDAIARDFRVDSRTRAVSKFMQAKMRERGQVSDLQMTIPQAVTELEQALQFPCPLLKIESLILRATLRKRHLIGDEVITYGRAFADLESVKQDSESNTINKTTARLLQAKMRVAGQVGDAEMTLSQAQKELSWLWGHAPESVKIEALWALSEMRRMDQVNDSFGMTLATTFKAFRWIERNQTSSLKQKAKSAFTAAIMRMNGQVADEIGMTLLTAFNIFKKLETDPTLSERRKIEASFYLVHMRDKGDVAHETLTTQEAETRIQRVVDAGAIVSRSIRFQAADILTRMSVTVEPPAVPDEPPSAIFGAKKRRREES